MDDYNHNSKEGRNRKVKGMRKSKKPEQSPQNTVQFTRLSNNPTWLDYDKWTVNCKKSLSEMSVLHTISPPFKFNPPSKDFNRRSDLAKSIILKHLEPELVRNLDILNEDVELPAWKLWQTLQDSFGLQYNEIKSRDFMFMKDIKKLREALESGWNINIPQADGRTPLAYAISKQWILQSEMLIDAGADVNARYIPLSLAGHVEAITSKTVKETLFQLAETGQYQAYSNFLKQYPKLQTLCAAPPIFIAVDISDFRIFSRLIDKKAKIQICASQWDNEITLLHLAAYRRFTRAIKLILTSSPGLVDVESIPDTEFLHGHEGYIGYYSGSILRPVPMVTDKRPNRDVARALLPVECWRPMGLMEHFVTVFGDICVATSNRKRVWAAVLDSKIQYSKSSTTVQGYNDLAERLIFQIGQPSEIPHSERKWIKLRMRVCGFILFHWAFKESGGFGGLIYDDIKHQIEQWF
ncbi:hypothetical protein HK098_003757 [Nowakowskiella sp. JEL0407]|nr:hypothetical protein HK098_003757 [Nowakowskiella sp. JEL0407]